MCDRLQPEQATPALLVSPRGRRLRYNRVWSIFHRLLIQTELTGRTAGSIQS
ncbi:hypothetical protein MLP_18920 [Microlunatus phosphovorus NM-1]|uniref:Uncharacterized protein n=1 Tax=Microlunatus phosphovorus (strain ATCC 700054 / DSM 10555 / JCM 9379 / NBRC 101784 / NCIMB 13414 / VKM Ac-1990 / NM-1) TaxID=1032480 RepID=F5XT34_MICPN|nr:hypothetical protein MLP_18920 [Microlunatus phosphovorus NM-1]